MFGFLKDKLKKAVDSFSKKAEDELEETPKTKSKDSKEAKNINKKKDKKEKKTKQEAESKKEKKEKTEEKKKDEKPIKEEKTKETKSQSKPDKKTKEKPDKTAQEPKEKSESAEEKTEEKTEEKKTGFFGKLFGKKDEKAEKEREPEDKKEKKKLEKEAKAVELEEELQAEGSAEDESEEAEEAEDESEEKEDEKESKGFFGKIGDAITKKTLSEEKFNELFWDLEISLLESNVAFEVIEKIKEDLKDNLVNSRISRSSIEEVVTTSLKKSIDEILTFDIINVAKKIKEKKDKPYTIVFVGVNGSGKTTTLAKIANHLKKQGFSIVMAAGDTFRAAAIHQLEIHAEKIGVKIIKQDYGSDAAAVAFDAIAHAKANKKDVVLIDTAGRSHANVNLMDELKKVIRVAKPDLTLFVGDSITGNDMVEQAREFNAAVNVDGLVLSKADVDEKGGATISATYVTKKPIVYIGTGQEYDNIEEFDKDKIMKNLEI